MMFRLLSGALSPAGQSARLSILIFHRVLPVPDPIRYLIPDVSRFDAMLGWVRAAFNVLPLPEAIDRLAAGTLPSSAAAITFDDGYADNYLHALPVLKKHGMHATFFIATDFLDGGIMWNDALGFSIRGTRLPALDCSAVGLGVHSLATQTERATTLGTLNGAIKHLPYAERKQVVEYIANIAEVDLPRDLMLSTEQLRRLRAEGMSIGAHTVTHPILAACDDGLALREIADGKQALQEVLGEKIDLFAYPNGKPDTDYRRRHVDMVQELGFSAAVTTAPGTVGYGDDLFQIPRFTPWGGGRYRFSMQMIKNLHHSRQAPSMKASS
ncbi:polysaccharide deacetylase family protein [Thauera sp. 63]|jgi:peptidoglycan/xylan/chitin deacetylase (PgdA/CDA1 family)|uniref:polysaccharide deacetylase family protein n=1 Tax=Thauera sp. 63 TaxID=497321 RepID=UPI0002CF7FC6|nr:polysaccharide deacetylase family protein [Thauera sp. 63]ENO78176.1 glycosyl transferase polysaccharide deacetylase [Thauera sp. 63]